MKHIKLISFMLVFTCTVFFVSAGEYEFTSADGGKVTFSVPDYLDDIIEDNYDDIQDSITEQGVSAADLQEAKAQLDEMAAELDDSDFKATYEGIEEGLSGFTKDLLGAIPSNQVMQNQWAQAWIGSIFPGFNFGFGFDVGVSTVSLQSLNKMAQSLDMDDFADLPTDFIPLPTINLDFRVGGVILPFDVGFSIIKFDSSRYSEISDMLGGFGMDYFSFGLDFRYAIIKDAPLKFKVALNGGIYYTNTAFSYEGAKGDSINSADLSFGAFTTAVGVQTSAKLACFVPFAGSRLFMSSGSLNWEIVPNWASMLGVEQAEMQSAIDYLLPASFGDRISSFVLRPQFYVGLGIDLFVVDITASVGYTLFSNVASAAVSFRIAWN